MNHYILQFDGGSRGNPGPSAAGAVIFLRGEKIWQCSKYLGDKYTNNYAEYQALILGLEQLKIFIEAGGPQNAPINVLIQGDSLLVINQLNDLWSVHSDNIKPLHKIASLLLELIKKTYRKKTAIILEHIKRVKNVKADELVNRELDRVLKYRKQRSVQTDVRGYLF